MHDFRPFSHPTDPFFPAGTGRLTAAAAAAVNNQHSLIKPYPSAMAGPLHPPPQLKCPRCESLNTKFCYYNNYNLSQPRHFCKSCRRYWTRGGVLRNVPVGGGCRKPKRSSSKFTSSVDKDRRRQTSGSLSSGDTSTSVADPAVIPFNSSSSNPNPSFLADIPLFPPPPVEIFSSLRFNFGDPDLVDRALDEELVYRTATDEPPPPGREEGGGVEWAPAMDPTIYEISGAGDPTAYWNHGHWTDGGDPSSLYLP